jgi:hypothetical protein
VAGSNLTAAVTMTTGNLDVRLYNSAGTVVQTAATAALTETATTTASTAGRYYIQVASATASSGSPYTMTVTTSNAITVTLNPSSAVENVGTLTAAGTVQLDAPAASAVTVNLTASAPNQLNFGATTAVNIAAGQTSGTFDIVLIDDPAGVPNASRFVTITAAATGYNSGSAQFEILDNEAALFVSWDKAAETASEAASPSIQLKAQLSGPAAGAVTVPFTLSGTATRGTDYSTPISAGQLTIAAGATSATYIISVIDDQESDPDETVIVTMGTPTGATASGTTTYTLTIADDEAPTGSGGGSGGAGGGGNTTGSCACTTAGGELAMVLAGLAALIRRRGKK